MKSVIEVRLFTLRTTYAELMQEDAMFRRDNHFEVLDIIINGHEIVLLCMEAEEVDE